MIGRLGLFSYGGQASALTQKSLIYSNEALGMLDVPKVADDTNRCESCYNPGGRSLSNCTQKGKQVI